MLNPTLGKRKVNPFPMPGDRIMIFDPRLFDDDVSTPISYTVRPATVVCRYGTVANQLSTIYPDLIDVKFDHRPESISKGHFTDGARPI